MKKYLLLTFALIGLTLSARAMSYEQARQQALFLTDKMAYELNLTEQQYEAAYEVNFDYLLGVNDPNELYGTYWTQRNLDLSYILLDWQYNAFVAASYFYRPLYWNAGYWHFGIYARYPHRDYFYFGRPHFFDTYRGGHCWHNNGGRSWYHGRDFVPNAGGHRPDKDHHSGMRDGFRRGDFGNGQRHFGNNDNNGRTPDMGNRNQNGGNMGGNNRDNGINTGTRNGNRQQGTGSSNFGTRRSSTRTTVEPSTRQTVRQSTSSHMNTRQEAATSSRSVINRQQSAGSSNNKVRSSSVGNRSFTTSPQRSSSSMSTRSVRSSSPSMTARPSAGSSMSTRSVRSSSPSMGTRSSGGSRSGGAHTGGGGSHGGRR